MFPEARCGSVGSLLSSCSMEMSCMCIVALQKGQLGRPIEEEDRGGAAKDSKNSAFMPGAVPGIGM